MDTGKAKGNFSSAYKLSRSTVNNKAVRRERRSIEQKELRHEEVNKRRNLCDLSPLLEGDLTAQDKSYKDKTPTKRKDGMTKKGLERLEQLKKWKQERERKRKMDEEDHRKKNPVFRVSKAVDHTDTGLFGKSGTKKHPVKPKSVPAIKPSGHSEKVSLQKSVPHPKPAAHTGTTSKPREDSRTRQRSGTRQTAGHQQSTAARGTSRGPISKPEHSARERANKKAEKVPASKPVTTSTRTLRSARQSATSQEPKTRTTRQMAKNKATESKFKAPSEPELVFEHQPEDENSTELDMTKVTRRGDTSFLPADSFAQTSDFGFNASSFVFRPLSPASAAGFLGLNPDSSCVSFLETNPNRSSTPKKPKESKKNCSVLNKTDVDVTQDVTQMNNTAIAQNEETVTDAKEKSDNASETDKEDKEIEQKPRRSSRRSIASTNVNESIEKNKSFDKVKSTPRRSLRRSVLSVNTEFDESTKTDDGAQKPRRSTQRRSSVAPVSSDSDSKESLETETESPVKRGRSLRSAAASVGSDSEGATEKKTPKSTRKSRRSVALICEPEVIPEVAEDTNTSQESNDVFEENEEVMMTDEEKEDMGPASKKDLARLRSSTSNRVDFESEKNTPTNKKKKRSRNKSFGGFRMPDTESVVLSAKRHPRRKTLMPKSPEEWIEVLSNSPMVEMTRRKHKYGDTTLPTLNFDDVDLDEPNSSMAMEEMDKKVAEAGSENSEHVPMEMNEVSAASVDVLNDSNKENVPQAIDVKAIDEEDVVQVGEISSTQDGPSSEDSSSDCEQDVPYFRQLLCTQTNRLNGLNDHWNLINENSELSEEIHGQIRTTVGQSMLLMNQRFKQFSGLVDDCEFKLGEKETTCMDLKGFWEMIYYQVEDVHNKFAELSKLQSNNWVDDKPKPVKKIKKKVTKPGPSKPAVKSKFAAFRAQMKKQKDTVSSPMAKQTEEEKVFEVPGFFTVSSPVRSPKPHCEGGTPKKVTPSVSTEENKVAKDTLAAPSSSELLSQRTPSRKSYLPAVPSPLLKDTTPLPRPTRTCTHRTPIPKRIIDDVEQSVQESDSKRVKRTPARRSLRPRKSVNFSDEVNVGEISSPTVQGTDADFARLLQPMTEEPVEEKSEDVMNDSLSKYLQPLSAIEKEDTPKQGRNRRASLKGCRSTERRRSRQRSVHFMSPSAADVQHVTLPHTPYNKDSLVKQKRVTRSHQIEDDDVFSIDNIDNDENVPPPTFRSPRPSLLGTPPDMKGRRANVSAYVPTGTLISFTP